MVTTLIIIGIAVLVLLLARSMRRILTPGSFAYGPVNHVTGGTAPSAQNNSLPNDWITDPGYWWMPGNIYYDEQTDADAFHHYDDDWNTNPACSHIPGNMYHDTYTGSCTGNDWMTDPDCCYMPGNIYYDDHDDDCVDSTSSWDDDDWSSNSTFDDDFDDD